MSRTMPTECDACDGIIDWGDFGPEDGTGEPTCTCPPAPPLQPPTYHGTNAVMHHGDELWHHGLGRGKVKAWQYGRDGTQIRAGIVATWQNHEGELLTWIPSIRHSEITPGPPPPVRVTVEIPADLAEQVAAGPKVVPKDTAAVDLWRHLERALRQAKEAGVPLT